MRNRNSKTAQEWLKSNGKSLSSVLQRANKLSAVASSFEEQLPTPYRGCCKLLNVDHEHLAIGCSNHSLATRLRWEAKVILNVIEDIVGFRPERLVIRPLRAERRAPPRKATAHKQLGPGAKRQLAQLESSEQDPELKEIFKRLHDLAAKNSD